MSRPYNEEVLANPPEGGIVVRISPSATKVLSAYVRAYEKRHKLTKKVLHKHSIGDLVSEAIIAAYDETL